MMGIRWRKMYPTSLIWCLDYMPRQSIIGNDWMGYELRYIASGQILCQSNSITCPKKWDSVRCSKQDLQYSALILINKTLQDSVVLFFFLSSFNPVRLFLAAKQMDTAYIALEKSNGISFGSSGIPFHVIFLAKWIFSLFHITSMFLWLLNPTLRGAFVLSKMSRLISKRLSIFIFSSLTCTVDI